MNGHNPEEIQYVEEIIYMFLDSLRKTKQNEARYRTLPPEVKAASGRELREIARRTAVFIIENIDSLGDLDELADNELLRKALAHAVASLDNNNETD